MHHHDGSVPASSKSVPMLAKLCLFAAGMAFGTGIGSTANVAHADPPHCTLNALTPSGTPALTSFKGEFYCDQPVARFRLMVSLESWQEDQGPTGLCGGPSECWYKGQDLGATDFTNGELSGAVTEEVALPTPLVVRAEVRAFIISEDWQEVTSVGVVVSPAITYR
jgi:hypothetical protein